MIEVPSMSITLPFGGLMAVDPSSCRAESTTVLWLSVAFLVDVLIPLKEIGCRILKNPEFKPRHPLQKS